MAAEAIAVTRDYALCELPRLRDVLAASDGRLSARYSFCRSTAGLGATVSIATVARLNCQRCLQAFDFAVDETAEIGFSASEDAVPLDSEREFYVMSDGAVSLRDLAEEELILALPLVAACDAPATCGNTTAILSDVVPPVHGDSGRPFAGLQELLKRT